MDSSWQNEINRQYETKLLSNNVPIELIKFPKEFLTRVLLSAISTLKGVNQVQIVELALQNKTIKLKVNTEEVPLGNFPEAYIANTIQGLVRSLKGVGRTANILIQLKAI